MAIVHEFKFTPAPGNTLISIQAWVETLPSDQKTEFYSALARQDAAKSQVVQEGNLALVQDTNPDGTVEPAKFVWKDIAAAQENMPMDPVWLTYFHRYLSENNITFDKIETEV